MRLKARRARKNRAGAMLAVAAALWAAPTVADAEPARADAGLVMAYAAAARGSTTLQQASLGGAPVALTVIGRTGYADTETHIDYIEESQEMRGFLPGYPQPALVTFGVEVAF